MTKKAITPELFRDMPPDTQMNLLQRDGAYIGKRIAEGQPAILYQLQGFYVEVRYEAYRKHVEQIVASDDTALLQPYLEQVKVRDLDTPAPGDQSSA
ncbi:hypothetical protein EPD60_15915 [Flaviaesturariibacter flavus]|uniref:Uncharacterized protein n=1 Tax=Flaviaesturariibacter flavus TaxID=2502780 RepID=A0A4R1B1X9_9BACT|nr:hypothetical protein [Flaviaesturariibacter flavus]TCJ12042.1 hypothetical protein EPD60_15915 [Flaviaesturariibacter flavus]